MKKRSEIAIRKFTDGYNCAQAVFYSFCDELKIEKEIALKLGTGFGAGMGRKEEVCGAISGGIMVIGAKYGRGEKEDRAAMERSYLKVQNLMDQFAAQHGSYICRQLLNGCELTTKEGQSYFKKNNLLKKTCTPCVQSVVAIVEKIL